MRVVDRSTCSVKGTSSGGVREPSNLAHYPQLGASKDALSHVVQADGPLPWTTSFKDKLLVARSPSITPPPPRSTAGRTVQRDEAQGTSEMGDIDQLQLPVGNQQVS